MTHLRSRKMTQAKNATWRRARTRSSIIHAEGVRGGLRFIHQERGKLFVCTKSPAGEHVLAYFGARQIQRRRLSCNLGSTTLEQGNGSILASKPGSILASAAVVDQQFGTALFNGISAGRSNRGVCYQLTKEAATKKGFGRKAAPVAIRADLRIERGSSCWFGGGGADHAQVETRKHAALPRHTSPAINSRDYWIVGIHPPRAFATLRFFCLSSGWA